ncbi:hypothetical protein HYH03_006429 [Edaphochlamys debaryana]|uniref:SET domain-containing protein n=1 Tax=Edaphochlamys debaryana TaxID=47281 RepID=A0A835YDE2_9CHLO|nr:hypothetical protein HYH03_006429 [Edaphochlamys debaryana]|eukprot:KAG2495484.1 hypothetical protein HYH03_006429 [Edaphochlamys debaryana]
MQQDRGWAPGGGVQQQEHWPPGGGMQQQQGWPPGGGAQHPQEGLLRRVAADNTRAAQHPALLQASAVKLLESEVKSGTLVLTQPNGQPAASCLEPLFNAPGPFPMPIALSLGLEGLGPAGAAAGAGRGGGGRGSGSSGLGGVPSGGTGREDNRGQEPRRSGASWMVTVHKVCNGVLQLSGLGGLFQRLGARPGDALAFARSGPGCFEVSIQRHTPPGPPRETGGPCRGAAAPAPPQPCSAAHRTPLPHGVSAARNQGQPPAPPPPLVLGGLCAGSAAAAAGPYSTAGEAPVPQPLRSDPRVIVLRPGNSANRILGHASVPGPAPPLAPTPAPPLAVPGSLQAGSSAAAAGPYPGARAAPALQQLRPADPTTWTTPGTGAAGAYLQGHAPAPGPAPPRGAPAGLQAAPSAPYNTSSTPAPAFPPPAAQGALQAGFSSAMAGPCHTAEATAAAAHGGQVQVGSAPAAAGPCHICHITAAAAASHQLQLLPGVAAPAQSSIPPATTSSAPPGPPAVASRRPPPLPASLLMPQPRPQPPPQPQPQTQPQAQPTPQIPTQPGSQFPAVFAQVTQELQGNGGAGDAAAGGPVGSAAPPAVPIPAAATTGPHTAATGPAGDVPHAAQDAERNASTQAAPLLPQTQPQPQLQPLNPTLLAAVFAHAIKHIRENGGASAAAPAGGPAAAPAGPKPQETCMAPHTAAADPTGDVAAGLPAASARTLADEAAVRQLSARTSGATIDAGTQTEWQAGAALAQADEVSCLKPRPVGSKALAEAKEPPSSPKPELEQGEGKPQPKSRIPPHVLQALEGLEPGALLAAVDLARAAAAMPDGASVLGCMAGLLTQFDASGTADGVGAMLACPRGACKEGAAPRGVGADLPPPQLLPASSLSAAHLQGCTLSPAAGAPPPALQPGELRLCGLTFHLELAPGVRSAMEVWEAGLVEQLAAVGLDGGLADAEPEDMQLQVLDRSSLHGAGIKDDSVTADLARLLGLAACFNAALPEHAPQLGPRSLAPGPDEGRGGAGLFAAAALRKGAVLGVMGGYVMPKDAAKRFADQGFLLLSQDAKVELAARAGPGPGPDMGLVRSAWQLLEGAFRLPMPGSPDGWELSMLGYGSLAALMNDPRREPRGWVEGNDVGDEGGAAAAGANCAVVPVSVRGLTLPVVVALRDIQSGEQLLRDYGAEWWRRHEEAWGMAEHRGLTAQAVLHPRTAASGLVGSIYGSGRQEAMPQAEAVPAGQHRYFSDSDSTFVVTHA